MPKFEPAMIKMRLGPGSATNKLQLFCIIHSTKIPRFILPLTKVISRSTNFQFQCISSPAI